MEKVNIFVYDKYDLYFDSLEEMADDLHIKLNFYNLRKLKDFKINSKKQHLFFIAYEPIDFYLLFEKKINFNNVIIATKNNKILSSLENTFHIRYVDLNVKRGVIRNLSNSLKKDSHKKSFY